jgi:LysM repeat protein
MKKISFWVLILVFTVSLARAQDTATQQQLDKLSGQIQDILEAQAQQGRRIDALEKDISDLRDKVNTPVVNNSASAEDLRALAQKVQEIDQKRQDDRDMIVAQIEKLAKATAGTPLPTPHHEHVSTVPTPSTGGTGGTGTPAQNGYEYPIKPGDTLGLIVKAYRDKGVKVTVAQIIAANPNMNPNVIIPGKTIFIPDASAK